MKWANFKVTLVRESHNEYSFRFQFCFQCCHYILLLFSLPTSAFSSTHSFVYPQYSAVVADGLGHGNIGYPSPTFSLLWGKFASI